MKKIVIVLIFFALLLVSNTIIAQYTNYNGADSAKFSTHTYTTVYVTNTFSARILQADKTVNFTSSMTLSQIQDSISSQIKNLNGHNLIFQFANGNYNFGTNGLIFQNFHNGFIFIRGNQAEAVTQHSNQSVILTMNSPTDNSKMITVQNNTSCNIEINRIAMQCNSPTAEGTTNIYLYKNVGCVFSVYANLFYQSPGTTRLYHFFSINNNQIYLYNNIFSTGAYSILANEMTTIFSSVNSSDGTMLVGILSQTGSTVIKSGVQPAATTPESTLTGGLIR